MKFRNEISVDRLREVLEYDPVSGVFTWKVAKAVWIKPGRRAGCVDDNGYVVIEIDGVRYLAHRLAWLYTHGVWPDNQIDHKDLVRSNNAIENLRPSDQTQNLANTPVRSDNTSGFKGVSYRKGSIGWQAKITMHGKQKHLGYFKTPELAHEAYEIAARREFGDFANP